ncbi:MAG: hypothetical protein ACFCD0_16510 [Gemmataceae bacterium]
MSVTAGQSQLRQGLQLLRQQWDVVLLHWADTTAKDFQEQFWKPIEDQTLSTIQAMDRLGQLLHRVHKDCQEDR